MPLAVMRKFEVEALLLSIGGKRITIDNTMFLLSIRQLACKELRFRCFQVGVVVYGNIVDTEFIQEDGIEMKNSG